MVFYPREISLKLFIILIMLCAAIAVSMACGGREAPPADETEPVEPIQATPAPQPSSGDAPQTTGEQPDYSLEALIKNWPEDVPLMEPYNVSGYLPEYAGFRQITIIVNAPIGEVYIFYADHLFNKWGWEPVEESKSGVPNLFLSFKCRKDKRELDMMLKSENDGRATLAKLGLTDLDKHKKKSEGE